MTCIYQVAKPVYRALQLLNKLANGRIFRSDAQPQVDNVDVWGTLDDSLQKDANHAVFITNFNVSCDAKPLPARQLNLTLRTSPACTPSRVTVYTIDDVNGAPPAATPRPFPRNPFPLPFFLTLPPKAPTPVLPGQAWAARSASHPFAFATAFVLRILNQVPQRRANRRNDSGERAAAAAAAPGPPVPRPVSVAAAAAAAERHGAGIFVR